MHSFIDHVRQGTWLTHERVLRSWRSFATEECGSTTFDFFLIAAFTATAIVIATEAMGISLPRALGLNAGR